MDDPQSLEKRPSEARVFSMDFSANLDLATNLASVVSVTISPADPMTGGHADPTWLTAGTPSVNGKRAQCMFSAGHAGQAYEITFVVTTNGTPAETLEGDGILNVVQR